MPGTATSSHLARPRRMNALRMLVWIEKPRFQGYGCSECTWTFKPSGPLKGNSLDEMKKIYKRQRDTEFAIHVCAGHHRAKKANG